MKIAQLAHLSDPATCPRLVVKVGSALLVGKDGQPRREWLTALVAEIAAARGRGQEVIVVSSGAIALGARRLGLAKGGRGSLSDAQAAASVGQIALAGLWAELLGQHGLTAAQILLTLEDLEDRRRYLNVTATLGTLLAAGAVPVINENDSVATQEIRFGDNDRLAARVGQAAGAQGVLLLSDIDGLYDRDPRQPGAVRIPVVKGVTPEIHAMATGGSSSGLGSGGMTSKLQAAEIAELAGMALAIIDGQPVSPIGTALSADRGTLFLPRGRRQARKAWLGGKLRVRGSVTVDEGAVRALRGGSSLLAAGVTTVEGQFQRGDAIAVTGPDGAILARGLSEYDAAECARLLGRHTREHEAILGYAPRSALIHRDQLVLL
ncbi:MULTISPECIES: glutamate 5-kinase [unclassified Novosphingobium]|uniref:glutamate 5-kinase n=1 Tax=unclassified Novosphingobium TaxID=2644732 RepID=UPI000F5FFA2C|nr:MULTISPECIES: glutamate 5-kinase [unclassified Novosphingobium]MBF5089597.1 glutamate 5-kinase [Novosphingobium sp. NBM11]RQW44244.1 glutamate 5-kinase [Novosphingobium sp. LASN5T]